MNDEPQRKPVGRPFEKDDSRINRAGKPRHFDAFRELAQAISHERVIGPDGNTLTRVEALLRSWSKSKCPQLQLAFVQYAYGKPPEKIEANLEPKTTLRLYYAHEKIPDRETSAFQVLPPNVERLRRLKDRP
jgi:hypothetical protein